MPFQAGTSQPSPAAAWLAAWPGPAFVVDAQLRILFAKRERGAEPDLLGRSLQDLVAEPERARVAAAVQDAFHPGLAHTVEFPLGVDGGPPRWMLATILPVPGAAAAVVLGTDVTARHVEEERLRHAERLMVDSEGITHLGIWYWDVTQPHAWWSHELYRIYGLDPERHVPTYQDYLTRIHPEDVERVKAATEAVFRAHTPYAHDERIRRSDGVWRQLHTWARPVLDAEGRLKALMGVCQDVTEARDAEAARDASEARFRALFDRSAVGIALLSPEGLVLEANAALVAMTGPLPTGTPFGACLDEEGSHALQRHLAEVAHGAVDARRLEVELGRSPRRPARLDLVRVQPPRQPPFVMAIAGEAASAAETEAAANLAMTRLAEIHRLEEAGERRERLLRVASHELKNPLTPVLFQLYLLDQGAHGPLNARQARAVAIAAKQADRIKHLLEDVLDMARIEQGRLRLQPARVDAADLVAKVGEAYADIARTWGLELVVDAPAGLWVEADAKRLEQVVVNLLGNALKFTPSGGRVLLRVWPRGGEACIEVEDTGPGIPQEKQASLFEAFSQMHEPGTSREEGTGLGLYISQHIVRASGGRIEVRSEPGRGSTFRVVLPASPEAPPAAEAAAEA
ncbi:MAG TPA: ATP-binding protein [Candidatus Thermoplasmatota archaeon]|nr:ATP-binding protein [Candidatus Thermoplasmatota archaeon]